MEEDRAWGLAFSPHRNQANRKTAPKAPFLSVSALSTEIQITSPLPVVVLFGGAARARALDPVQILGRDVASCADTLETEASKRSIAGFRAFIEAFRSSRILVDQRIGANLGSNLISSRPEAISSLGDGISMP